MADQQSYGIKIAAPGYDVNTAPDYALIFNSSWPSVPVAKTYTIQVTPTFDGSFWSYPLQKFNHNLGFYAWASLWEINGPQDSTFAPTGGITTVRRNDNLLIGKNTHVWQNSYFKASQPPVMTLHLKIYNVDISQHVAYQYLQPPVIQVPYDSNYGIKVAKPGKTTNSKDLRDYVIHSRAQSPAILSILTQADAVGGTVSYTNPQAYTNWVYGYAQIIPGSGYGLTGDTLYKYATAQAQGYPFYTFVNGTTYTLNTQNGQNNVSLIVLRDPLLVPQKVNITYNG